MLHSWRAAKHIDPPKSNTLAAWYTNREIEIYRTVWPRLCKYYRECVSRWTWKASDSNAAERATELQKAGTDLIDFIWDIRPFFPTESFDQLTKFADVCDELARLHSTLQGIPMGKPQEELMQRLQKLETKAKEEFKELEVTIRRRFLTSFRTE